MNAIETAPRVCFYFSTYATVREVEETVLATVSLADAQKQTGSLALVRKVKDFLLTTFASPPDSGKKMIQTKNLLPKNPVLFPDQKSATSPSHARPTSPADTYVTTGVLDLTTSVPFVNGMRNFRALACG